MTENRLKSSMQDQSLIEPKIASSRKAAMGLFIGPLASLTLPGAPFILAAALLLASIVFSIRVARGAREGATAIRQNHATET